MSISNAANDSKCNWLYVISTDNLDDKAVERLNLSLSSLSKQRNLSVRACVADYGSDSVLRYLNVPENLVLDYFHKPLEGPFNKPYCINYAFRRFEFDREPYFFFSDIDLIYPCDFGDYFVNKYASFASNICVTGRTFYQDHDSILYTDDYSAAREKIESAFSYRGGCLMISSALFKTLCGYDESFYGWGGEDDEFLVRASREGIFITDESVEFVHLYHPRSRRNSANANLLERKRKEHTTTVDKKRSWGEESHVPSIAESKKELVQNGWPVRAPYLIAQRDGEGFLVESLESGRSTHLNPTAFLAWTLCDGRDDGYAIADHITELYNGEIGDIADDLAETLKSQEENNILRLHTEESHRQLLRISSLGIDSKIDLYDTLIFGLSQVVSIFYVEWHEEADLRIIGGSVPPEHLDQLSGLVIRLPDEFQVGADLMVESVRVDAKLDAPESSIHFRAPDWWRAYAWTANGRGKGCVEQNALFRQDKPSSKRVHDIVLIGKPRSKIMKALVEALNSDGLHHQVEIIDPNQEPWIKLYQKLVSSKISLIDEPDCPAGAQTPLLSLALAAQTVPFYNGDRLAHYDFNSNRFVSISDSDQVESHVSEIVNLLTNRSLFHNMVSQPLFSSNNVPPQRLLPGSFGQFVLKMI